MWETKLTHNITALLVEEEDGFKDVVRWLKRCKISFAIQEEVPIYKDHIEQFWNSAVFVDEPKGCCYIKAKVHTKNLVITEDVVRKTLKLNDNPSDTISMTKEDVLKGFKKMGYEGAFDKRNEIMKALLSHEWRFICHVFCICMGNRKGGYDGLTIDWSVAMLRLCEGKPFNISGLIFDCMKANVHCGTWMMYPRFVQMMINHVLKKLPPGKDVVEPSKMTTRIYKECRKSKNGFSGKWTPLFDNMYPVKRYPVILKMFDEAERKRLEKKKKVFESETQEEEEESRATGVKRKRKQKNKVSADEDIELENEIENEKKKKKRKGKEKMTGEDMEAATILQQIYDENPQSAPSSSKPTQKTPKQNATTHFKLYKTLVKEVGKVCAKEIMCLKEKVRGQKQRISLQNKVINEQADLIMFQNEVMIHMFKMIGELQDKLNVESRINQDELFDYEKFKERKRKYDEEKKAREAAD